MKVKKAKSSELVTRAVLKEELKDLVTKKELDLSLKEAFDKHEERHREDRDKILTAIDGVMGELETMRGENTVGAHQIRELEVKVDDHEKRITNLESNPA